MRQLYNYNPMIKQVKNTKKIESIVKFDVNKALQNVMKRSFLINKLDSICHQKQQEMKTILSQFRWHTQSQKKEQQKIQLYRKIIILQYEIFGLIQEKRQIAKILREEVNEYQRQLQKRCKIQMNVEPEMISLYDSTLSISLQREIEKNDKKKGLSSNSYIEGETQQIIISSNQNYNL